MMLMAKYAIPEMRKARRAVSIIDHQPRSTGLSRRPSAACSIPTSKGAVVQARRGRWRRITGREGIRVNCIAPGYGLHADGGIARHDAGDAKARAAKATLLGTEGTGWDIGYGALFLASDESRWITGITLPIDGGATAGSKGLPVPPSEPASS